MKNSAMAIAFLTLCCYAPAQEPSNLIFEVASVKPSAPPAPGQRAGIHGGPGTSDPGRIRALRISLTDLIMRAWGVNSYQVMGPDWITYPPAVREAGRYDVLANVPPNATAEQVMMMWRNLVADRFGIIVHYESRALAASDLVIVKSGTKMKRSSLDPAATAPTPELDTSDLTRDQVTLDKNGCVELSAPAIVFYMTNGPGGTSQCMAVKGQSPSQIANRLSERYRHPVIDKTGLDGAYDFTIRYGPGMKFEDVMEQQLGLKLVDSKATVDVIVVDRANKMPSEN